MRERSALVPHLYTALRHVYDTGVHVMRPMYYRWPRDDLAYRASSYSGCANAQLCQYMLGEEMLVAPALAPSDNVTSMTSVRVWLPRGWFSTRLCVCVSIQYAIVRGCCGCLQSGFCMYVYTHD